MSHQSFIRKIDKIKLKKKRNHYIFRTFQAFSKIPVITSEN